MYSEKNGIRFLASPALESFAGPSGIIHGFLTRTGGVSPPPFSSLNFDPRGEDAGNVERNKKLLSEAFSAPLEGVITVNQIHGNGVVVVEEKTGLYDPAFYRSMEADAIITGSPGVPIGVLTADCVPMLLFDPVKRAIGAVHAGWKGTCSGVSINAIELMRSRFGSKPRDIVASVGPHIGQCCYSVNDDVLEGFGKSFEDAGGYFTRAKGRLRCDLGRANISRLVKAGLLRSNISLSAPCTSCNNGLFFSYRKEGPRTGRQLSFIMLG